MFSLKSRAVGGFLQAVRLELGGVRNIERFSKLEIQIYY